PGLLRTHRLPDPQRQRAHRLELLPEPEGAKPAVLVVDGGNAARGGELQAAPHRVDVRLVGDGQVTLSEAPGRLLTQDPGRLAGFVALDDPAFDLEVAAGECERSAVEPERVIVLGKQCGRRRARDLVEARACRLLAPLAAAPAEGENRSPFAAVDTPDTV